MSKVVVMDHPLIQHKIGIIRRTETSSKEFREMIGEIAMLMCYEATRDLKLEEVEIETPITKMTAKELAGKKLAVVPILRAGLGMVEGMLAMIPAAKVGHIGLYRDPETLDFEFLHLLKSRHFLQIHVIFYQILILLLSLFLKQILVIFRLSLHLLLLVYK